MSASLKIPHDARIVVADARKALLISNTGDEVYPNLRVIQTLHAPANPRTSEQGTDRPGRAMTGSRKSAVGQTDWHRQAETHFAGEVVKALLNEGDLAVLILVAPPTFLAELRKVMPERTRSAIHAEIAKDLTHLPVSEIEQHLLSS